MVKHIFTTFVTRFWIALSNLAIAIIVSNFIGAAGKGEQSLIITLISFILIITSIVGSGSISYLLPRHPFLSLVIPSYAWTVGIIVLCFILLPHLNLIPSAYVNDVCVLGFLLAVSNIHSSILISKQRINAANLSAALQSMGSVIILLFYFIILKERNIHSYIVSLYFGYGLSLLVSFIMVKQYFTATPEFMFHLRKSIKQLVELGFYNQIAVFTQLLSFRLSYYILNAFYGTGVVGIYSNAISIAESIWLIGRSIATVQHSIIVNSTDAGYSLKLTSSMNRINVLISVCCLLILAIVPESWYIWLFGDEFVGINKIIWTIAPGILFFGMALIQGYYFSSTGKHYVNAIASTVGLIVTIVAGFILIPEWGSHGAGIAASISYGITALVVVYYYKREMKLIKK